MQQNLACHKCGQNHTFHFSTGISRRDECSSCREDLRVCKNCRHYDTSSKWECRESISEAVREKEKANFCDFFQPRVAEAGSDSENKVNPGREDLLSKAEALFKK